MPAADHRKEVFARIREALRRAAPHRHVGHVGDHPAAPDHDAGPPGSETFRAWLPLVGESLPEQIELFAKNSAALKTEFHRAASLEEAAGLLGGLARGKRLAPDRHPCRRARPAAGGESGTAPPRRRARLPPPRSRGLRRRDHRLRFPRGPDGSLLVSGPSAGGRALSVLPPHHVVIARTSQIVPDLVTALQQAQLRYAAQWPSFISFITGPSRTGDIERILVLGAHGPKRLTGFSTSLIFPVAAVYDRRTFNQRRS